MYPSNFLLSALAAGTPPEQKATEGYDPTNLANGVLLPRGFMGKAAPPLADNERDGNFGTYMNADEDQGFMGPAGNPNGPGGGAGASPLLKLLGRFPRR